MFYCNDFKSLSVLSLYEGELLGVVDKLFFDKKMKKLLEIELVGSDGAKLFLPTKNIYHVGKNAITVRNNDAVSLSRKYTEFYSAPISVKVYSINGEFMGVVQEVAFNEKFLTDKIALENNTLLDVKDIASCGKNTIIFYNNNNKIKIERFEPKQPKVFKQKEIVSIAKTLPVDEVSVEPKSIEVKQPLVQDSSFLIGRICTKDIFNFNNEILIKAHAVVNKKNLKEINKFGKLRELMLFTK